MIIADPHAGIIVSCPFSPAVRGAVPSLTWILALALTEQGRRAGSSFAVGAGAAPRGEAVRGGDARAAPAEVCAVAEHAAVAGLLEIRPR